jgi:hypothetical protein
MELRWGLVRRRRVSALGFAAPGVDTGARRAKRARWGWAGETVSFFIILVN